MLQNRGAACVEHHPAGSVCYVWRSVFVHVCIQVWRRNMFESLPVTLPPSVSLLGSGSLTQCWIQTSCSDVLRWKSCIHLPESAIQLLRCSGAITGSQTPLLASSQMGRACWQAHCTQIIFLLCTHSHCGMIRLMRVHVCRYCCINYSLAISISLRKSVSSLMISYLSWNSHGCPPHDEHTMNHHRLQSHTSRCLPTSIDQLLTRSSPCEQADWVVSSATEQAVL